MRALVLAAGVAALAVPAAALDQMERLQLLNGLSTVMASEELCGLSYDQAAIEAYVDAEVPADDMSFISELALMVMGAGALHESLTESQRTAHCAAVRRSARHYGFLE